jgi:hypothetical protein
MAFALAWSYREGLGQSAPRGPSGAEVRLSLDDQANSLWQDIPADAAAGEKVRRLGATPPACATEALRRAKAALARGELGRLAVRALGMKVRLDSGMLKEQRISNVAHLAELFDQYLESSGEQDFVRRTGAPVPARAAALYQHFRKSRSDQVVLASPDAPCDLVRLFFDIRSLPGEPGRLYASFVAEGHCRCRVPAAAPLGLKLGRWRVAGLARMKPGDRSFEGQQAEVQWELDEPRYTVLAICGPCPRDDSETQRTAADPAEKGACSRCDPFEPVTKGWEDDARRAEAAAKATRGGAAAVKALAERAAAARQAAAEARDAGQWCREQCVVPPPIVAPSDPVKTKGSGKKVVLGVGAAAVVGGGIVALGSGGDSSPPRAVSQPSPPPATPEPTPTPRAEPTPTPTPTPTPRPTPTPTAPPPATCPAVFAAYTGRVTTVSNSGCAVATTFSATLRISGTCSAAVFTISESQGNRNYAGSVAADGTFSGTGGGTLQSRFTFTGSISGLVNGPSVNADEALNFTAGCPGQRVVYRFSGSR